MKKIISLFQRNYDGDRLVRDEVVPGAEWVLAGEGVATRKWDGTCCLVRNGVLYKRYDLKRGKKAPVGFEPAQESDPKTGNQPGWVPVGEGPEDQWHREAWRDGWPDGTYELCGPKVGGGDHNGADPEGIGRHILIPHGHHRYGGDMVPRTYDGLKAWLAANNVEGIVWWRDPEDPDCDKVKIKAKDFGIHRKGSSSPSFARKEQP